MAYTANKYRKINTTPAPKFDIDGIVISSRKFMHTAWWYVINNSWHCEGEILAENSVNLIQKYQANLKIC